MTQRRPNRDDRPPHQAVSYVVTNLNNYPRLRRRGRGRRGAGPFGDERDQPGHPVDPRLGGTVLPVRGRAEVIADGPAHPPRAEPAVLGGTGGGDGGTDGIG